MLRVMHFADTHFGVELYGRLDPETGLHSRLLDFKRSLLKAIELSLEANIDLAIFAGDAYKTRDPRQTDQREFARCIRELTDAGIPVVMLAGNHDLPNTKGRANAVEIYHTLDVQNVHVLSKPDIIVVETKAGKVRIAGMPYLIKGLMVAREEFQGKSLQEGRLYLEQIYSNQIRYLADQVREANDNLPTILMGHFWVTGASLSKYQTGYLDRNEPQVPLSAVTDSAFDYVALGHIHKHQDLNQGKQPPVVYCGSPDRIDFGEKDESKGFVLLELEKGNTRYRHVPVDVTRPLLDIQVDATGENPTETIVAAIRKQNIRGSIVRVRYEYLEEQTDLIRIRDIREALNLAHYLVSIEPSVKSKRNLRMANLNERMTPRDTLEAYLESKEEYKIRKPELMERAELLFQELEEAV